MKCHHEHEDDHVSIQLAVTTPTNPQPYFTKTIIVEELYRKMLSEDPHAIIFFKDQLFDMFKRLVKEAEAKAVAVKA